LGPFGLLIAREKFDFGTQKGGVAKNLLDKTTRRFSAPLLNLAVGEGRSFGFSENNSASRHRDFRPTIAWSKEF
jgi:hypothetical protein